MSAILENDTGEQNFQRDGFLYEFGTMPIGLEQGPFGP